MDFIDLKTRLSRVRHRLDERVAAVHDHGQYILGPEVAELEEVLADYVGTKHCVGVSSGTDSLLIALMALEGGPGDEVVTVSYTWISTAEVIALVGAKPVFVDIGQDFNMDVSILDQAVTTRTKAIVPVHLNGRMCDMDSVMEVAERYNLFVIEDAAQAVGAQYRGRYAGSFGQMGCFSMHPLKLLSVPGDGGFISAQDQETAEQLRMFRDHGQKTKEELVCFGFNSRLDNIHAALALIKMKHLASWIDRRRVIAARYYDSLCDISELELPPPPNDESLYYDVFSSFVVRAKDIGVLKDHLARADVEGYSHCSTPLYRHKSLHLGDWELPMTEQISREVLSLPIYPELTDADQQYVVAQIRDCFKY